MLENGVTLLSPRSILIVSLASHDESEGFENIVLFSKTESVRLSQKRTVGTSQP